MKKLVGYINVATGVFTPVGSKRKVGSHMAKGTRTPNPNADAIKRVKALRDALDTVIKQFKAGNSETARVLFDAALKDAQKK